MGLLALLDRFGQTLLVRRGGSSRTLPARLTLTVEIHMRSLELNLARRYDHHQAGDGKRGSRSSLLFNLYFMHRDHGFTCFWVHLSFILTLAHSCT
jgi:hypothetical protein